MKKWLSKNIINFSVASFFNDFCHEMTMAILPAYIQQISGTAAAPFLLGLIQGIADGASTSMKLISGFIADKTTSYKPFLIVGYGLTGILGLIGTTQNIFLILIYKTISWMSKGIREPIRDTWISKIVLPQFYGRAFGFHRACDTLGALVGPLCAFILLKLDFSFAIIFMVSIIPGFLSVVPILFLTDEKTEEPRDQQSITFRHQIMLLPKSFNYFLLIRLIFGMANFNQSLFIYRAQVLLSSGQAMTITTATAWTLLFYTFFNIIRGLSEFGMGILSDYVNRKNLLALFGFGFFALTSICFMIPITNMWILFLFFACAGLSTGTVKSLERSYAATLLPENVRGTGLGLLQTIDGITAVSSNVIVGALWSFISPVVGFAYASVFSFIAMVMLLARK